MKKFRFTLMLVASFCSLSVPLLVFAQGKAVKVQESVAQTETNKKKPESLALFSFTEFKMKDNLRGAPTWSEPAMTLGIGAELFDRFVFQGRTIYVRPLPPSLTKGRAEWAVGLSLISDKPMFRFSPTSFRNTRNTALELFTEANYRFGYRNLAYFGVFLAQGMVSHHGIHSELQGGMPVLPYTLLNAVVSVDSYDSSRYLYGEGAVAGLGFAEARVDLVNPWFPWDGVHLTQLSVSQLFQDENRNASLVQNQTLDWTVSTKVIWKFWTL